MVILKPPKRKNFGGFLFIYYETKTIAFQKN